MMQWVVLESCLHSIAIFTVNHISRGQPMNRISAVELGQCVMQSYNFISDDVSGTEYTMILIH